jgi:hypothetical protein
MMLNDRERVWIVHSIGRVGRRVKNGGHRDGGKVKEEVGNGEGSGTVHEEDTNVGGAKSGMARKKAGGFTCYVGVGPKNEGGEGTGVLEYGIRGVADPVVHGHFGRLGTGEEMVTVWIHGWIHGFGAGAMGWEVVEREAKFAFNANHPKVRGVGLRVVVEVKSGTKQIKGVGLGITDNRTPPTTTREGSDLFPFHGMR